MYKEGANFLEKVNSLESFKIIFGVGGLGLQLVFKNSNNKEQNQQEMKHWQEPNMD